MALNVIGMSYLFRADDLASRVMRTIRRNFGGLVKDSEYLKNKLNKNLKAVGIGTAVAFTGFAGLKAGMNLAKTADNFELELARVGAITHATANELNYLEKTARQAALATQFTPEESIEGLRNLSSQGFNVRDSAAILKPALDFAAAGMIDVDLATRSTAAALKVFKKDASESTDVVDVMIKATSTSALRAEDFNQVLSKLGKTGQAATFGMEALLSTVGLLRDQGTVASVGANQVGRSISYMASKSKEFAALGIQLTTQTGEWRGYHDIMFDTVKRLDKIQDKVKRAGLAHKLFGEWGKAAYFGIESAIKDGVKTSTGELLKGAAAIDYLANRLGHAKGEAQFFIDKLLETSAGQKKLLEGVVGELVLSIGKPLTAALKPVVKFFIGLGKAIAGVLSLFSEETKQKFATIFLIITTIMGIAGALIALRGAILGLKLLFPGLAQGLRMAIAPFLPWAAVISLVAYALYRFFKSDSSVARKWADKLSRAFEVVKMVFGGLIQIFTDGGFSGELRKDLNKAENQGVKKFLVMLAASIYRAKKMFDGFIDGLTEAFVVIGETILFLLTPLAWLAEALDIPLTGFFDWFSSDPSSDFELFGASLGVMTGALLGLAAAFKVARYAAVLWKGVLLVVKGLTLAYGAVQTFFNANLIMGAAAAWSLNLAFAAWAIALGAVYAVILVIAYKVGEWLEDMFKISDLIAELTGFADEDAKLNQQNGGLRAERGDAPGSSTLAQAAEAAGLSEEQYLHKRSGELAETAQAKKLGLDVNTIRDRLSQGLDPYTAKVSAIVPQVGPQPSPAVASAKGKRSAREKEGDALRDTLKEFRKSALGKGDKTVVNLKIGEEEMTQMFDNSLKKRMNLEFKPGFSGAGE